MDCLIKCSRAGIRAMEVREDVVKEFQERDLLNLQPFILLNVIGPVAKINPLTLSYAFQRKS